MKKKFKLLTSIASLGLALAVMTFGVLAAATKTLNVTSNVIFEAQNVNVVVSYLEVAPTTAWTAIDGETTGWGEITFTDNVANEEYDFNDAKLTETNKVAGYAIKIENKYASNQTVNIAFTDVANKGSEANGWVVTTSCPTSVAANSTVYAWVYVTVDGAKIVDGTEINLSSKLVFSLATAA